MLLLILYPNYSTMCTVLLLQVFLLRGTQMSDGRLLFPSHHAQWKVKTLEHQRRALAFKQLGIKRVMRETGTTEWYGCNKKTSRCFGTVSAFLLLCL